MGCSLSVKISPEHLRTVHKDSHCRELTSSPLRGYRRRLSPNLLQGHLRNRIMSDASTSPMTPIVVRGKGGRKSVCSDGIELGTKHAIVVGINRYAHWDWLECPEQDATDVSACFQARKFNVVLLLGKNATFRTIMRTLSSVSHTCETIVVSLHGHGVSGRNGASFLPQDANDNPEDLSDKITADFLKAWSRSWGGKHLLLLADCCFGGNFVMPSHSKMRGGGGKERVRMCISGSTVGELIPDRAEGSTTHSDLTHALLKSTKRRQWNGSVLDMFVHIRRTAVNVKIGRLPGDEGGDMLL